MNDTELSSKKNVYRDIEAKRKFDLYLKPSTPLPAENISFAENVFKEMLESQVSPNFFTYNTLIRGFSFAGNLDVTLQFFYRMEKKGCIPNVDTLIDGYCKLRKIDDGFELLRSMSLKGLESNLISWNVVINGMCREGRMKETSLVLTEMNRKGYTH